MVNTKLKINDVVKVISGKDRGKTGSVLKIDHSKGRVLVQGCNILTKTVRSRQGAKEPQKGFVRVEGYISISNVMYLDAKSHKPSRLGVRWSEVKTGEGAVIKKKHRMIKASGEMVNE